MLYNVSWNTSETKKIYQATKNSESLMECLEKCLLESGLAKLISEKPTPNRGYGVLYYYFSSKPKKRLLSSAPRRDHDHIHVVIFNNLLNQEQLQNEGFDVGNEVEPPDVKIHRKEEIEKLVWLIKVNLHLL
ncbi:hypothetical protein [Metabacillus schmidteae]|uniref:hypothetical protein n=1 Tax=Metabacillus schmidteae TaxID=2730405 RepID=UPI00158A520F|nr:hypothetical protein [Metabacillus schmidteae]